MGTVIQVDFSRRNQQSTYSVDLYTADLRCQKFDISASCPKLAFQAVVGSSAFILEQASVRAIAIYANGKDTRLNSQLPLLISHFKEPDQSAHIK